MHLLTLSCQGLVESGSNYSDMKILLCDMPGLGDYCQWQSYKTVGGTRVVKYGHEFEQVLEAGDGQGSLVCFSPWGHKELGMTEQLNWLNWSLLIFCLRIFFIDVLSRNWLFFGSFIVWFWHQGNEGFIEWVWQYFLTFNFTENLRRMGPNYSLNVWRITLWSHGVLYIRNQQNMAHESVHSAIYFVNKFCWNIRKLIYLCIIHNISWNNGRVQ